MPYITITVPSGTVIGRTVDTKIGATARVTLLSEETLRIEPDDVCTVITATALDGRLFTPSAEGDRPDNQSVARKSGVAVERAAAVFRATAA